VGDPVEVERDTESGSNTALGLAADLHLASALPALSNAIQAILRDSDRPPTFVASGWTIMSAHPV
jgi:hypothetical protein